MDPRWIVGGVAAAVLVAIVVAVALSGVLLGLIVLVAGGIMATTVAFVLGLFGSR